MFPKRRRFGFFDIDEEFEHIQEMMEKMMADAMKDMESGKPSAGGQGKPLVYGFSMRVGPDGKPVMEEFGNVKKAAGEGEKGSVDEREPLVDIINRKDEITIIAEVPGVEKHDIKTRLNKEGDVLHILVVNPERKYKKVLKLPARVKADGATASYKNGVLEVKLRKISPSAKDEAGHDIHVR